MCHSFEFFFSTKTRFASQSGLSIYLMNPAAMSLVISFLIAAFLSGANLHSFCLMGLDPLLTLIICSANFLGTPGMSTGFQAKISLLSQRKLVSASSYLGSRFALIIAVFSGSPVSRSIVFVATNFGGVKLLGFFAGI